MAEGKVLGYKRCLCIHLVFVLYLEAFMCMFNFLLKSCFIDEINANDCTIFRLCSSLQLKGLLQAISPSQQSSANCLHKTNLYKFAKLRKLFACSCSHNFRVSGSTNRSLNSASKIGLQLATNSVVYLGTSLVLFCWHLSISFWRFSGNTDDSHVRI